MTIDEAKRVRIVDFLAQLGHRAQYMKSEQYWYLSPLRKEAVSYTHLDVYKRQSLGFKKVGEKEINKGIVSIPMERNI